MVVSASHEPLIHIHSPEKQERRGQAAPAEQRPAETAYCGKESVLIKWARRGEAERGGGCREAERQHPHKRARGRGEEHPHKRVRGRGEEEVQFGAGHA